MHEIFQKNARKYPNCYFAFPYFPPQVNHICLFRYTCARCLGGYQCCTHIQGRCDVSVPPQVNRIGPFRYTCARSSGSYRRCTHIHGRCDVSVPPQVNHICLFRYTCARCSCIHQPCARTWGGACPRRKFSALLQHDSDMTPVENSLYVLLSPALFSLNKIVEIKYLKSN